MHRVPLESMILQMNLLGGDYPVNPHTFDFIERPGTVGHSLSLYLEVIWDLLIVNSLCLCVPRTEALLFLLSLSCVGCRLQRVRVRACARFG